MAGQFKILSLDGGGIRGIIPARILTTIEDKTKRPIADMFDLIAGTSTGGILATGLAGSVGGNKPIRTAAELLNMYVDRGSEIFKRSLWKGITSVGGLRDERYSAGPLETVLADTLGEAELKDVITNVLIPSYDIEGRGDYRGGGPYFFKSSKAKTDPDYNYFLRDVARATSAAPTYFEPAHIENRSGTAWTALIDGGVFANNPAACAYAEARKLGAEPGEIILVSLGTGELQRPIKYGDAKDWGIIEWAVPVLSVIFDGVADTVHYQMDQLLPDSAGKRCYYRFDTGLDKALDDFDAAHTANINALLREADDILASQAGALDEVCTMLTA